MRVFISIMVTTLCYFSLQVCAGSYDENKKTGTVFLSLPGYERKIGVTFDEEAEMVALYRGNNLYLRPISRKLRLLLGTEKAVATKTLSLPEIVAEEAVRGRQEVSSLLVSEQKFTKPADTFFLRLRNGKTVSGKFKEGRGNENKMGVVLFLKKGIHIYQFSVEEGGLDVWFHTLDEQQYKAAKKSVEKKLKAAGQKSAAKKVGRM